MVTLKYSGKSFRKTVWKTKQETWSRLNEEAWRAFGGCCQYVVLDNLKEGVIRPDIYAPELNPVYAAMLAHHSVVADPASVRDPNRKEVAAHHRQCDPGCAAAAGRNANRNTCHAQPGVECDHLRQKAISSGAALFANYVQQRLAFLAPDHI